jgi:ERAP1-like C-terminal domain
LTTSVLANDYSVIGECFRRYRLFSQDPVSNAIAPELRGLVYDTVIRFGNETYYNDMLKRYREATTDASERSRAMYALARTLQPNLIGRTLQWTMTDDVRSQDGIFVIRILAITSYTGASLAWDFVRENFDAILAKYGDRQVDTRVLQAVTTPFFVTNTKADEVRAFASGKSSLSAYYVDTAVSTIEANAVFIARNSDDLQAFLTTRYPVA